MVDNTQGSEQDTKYFASLPPEEAVSAFKSRSDTWFDTLINNSYLEKVRTSWLFYHGLFNESIDSGHSIHFSGEQGELVNISVNHYRNIAKHILNMITANRPSFQARAVNMDYKSLAQTKLANSLLDYYMREKKLEEYLTTAAELSISMGSGYLKMEWDSEKGEIHDYTDNGVPVYEGDVVFTNLSVLDVAFDTTKEFSRDHDWVVVRTFKNKFDLAAQFPEKGEEIRALRTKDRMAWYNRLTGTNFDKTTDVPVYEVFHKRTPAMPQGRYMLYLSGDIILMDTPMPYRELPVYRIAPSDILGTPYGYTPMFDLLPLQDALNSLYSTVLTNQNAFGVQNIAIPEGSNIVTNSIMGGMNIVKYLPMPNVPNGGAPFPLQLTQTPSEIFNFIEIIKRDMETISGINAVARGDTPANLESGAALALVQAQALQFMSGLQHSYIKLIEDVGSGLIHMLQDFAAAPRIAMIVGENNRSEMKEFSGEDVSNISRVFVDVGNALANSVAGRLSMAEQLMQMKPEAFTPEQYVNIINTGKLENMTSSVNSQIMLAKEENKKLLDGTTKPIALSTDEHWLHIKEHQAVIADPDLRYDDELVARTLDHINEHLEELRNADPDLLLGLGQQPLSMQNPATTGPGNIQGRPPEEVSEPGNIEQLAAGQTGTPAGAMMPGIPSPAEVPQGQGPMTASEALSLQS